MELSVHTLDGVEVYNNTTMKRQASDFIYNDLSENTRNTFIDRLRENNFPGCMCGELKDDRKCFIEVLP